MTLNASVETPSSGDDPGRRPAGRSHAALARAASIVAACRNAGEVAYPWLDLAVRFWLTQAFLAIAVMGAVMHAPVTMSGTGRFASAFNLLAASPVGFVIQSLCPVLLGIGLLSRLAAIPLLIQSLAMNGPGGGSDIHLFQAVLLGWIAVLGPGALSLDAVFARGIDSSAIPVAARLGALYGRVSRRLGPAYWVMMRAWVATAPAGAASMALLGADAMRRGPLLPWLADVPAAVATLPPGPSLLLAACIAAGFGTRIAAVALLAGVPLTEAAHAGDDRLYWASILGILILRGAGPLSLDRLIADRAAGWMEFTPGGHMAAWPRVVVVGGGFGGVAAAMELAKTRCRVTLVDRRNYHLFQPLLYQVATAALSDADITTPIRGLFRDRPNVDIRLADVVGVSASSREVLLGDGERVGYDMLILATGSRHSYFGKDEWAADAPGLKRIEDAADIRGRLLTAFERAEASADPQARTAWLTFVVVGGGPTGVELAGAIAELARQGLQREFRTIDPSAAGIVLVQSAPHLLPSFPPSLAADAEASLRRLGVDVRLGGRVERVDDQGVVVSGVRIPARTVLWAAGVMASPAAEWLGASTDKAGRITVGDDLTVPGHPDIFAIGDLAASTAWDGRAVPGLAPAAKQGGLYAARVIRARLAGRPPPGPFRYRHRGSLATIGRQSAVADFGSLRFRGGLAWWIWGLVHVTYLVGTRNRAAVLLDWAWAYLTYRRGTRLITQTRSRDG